MLFRHKSLSALELSFVACVENIVCVVIAITIICDQCGVIEDEFHHIATCPMIITPLINQMVLNPS